MLDFTKAFISHYFSFSWQKFFNNVNFWGFKIVPLNEKLYLYAYKQLANLQIEHPEILHMCVFFENYYLYSDLTFQQVELFYSYLIGFPEPPNEGILGTDWET